MPFRARCLMFVLLAAACRGGQLPAGPAAQGAAAGARISNAVPAAFIGGPYLSSPSGTVHFKGARAADPDGDAPFTFTWDFGDGTRANTAAPRHTYAATGTYQVSLRVTDARGGAAAPVSTTARVRRDGGVAVLSAAGNIAGCGRVRDEWTAAILDTTPGFVAALGDNAFDDGSAADYACYDRTWGRHKARTFAVMGNHEYRTAGAAAAFAYFGPRAGTPREGWYSATVGAWHVIVLNDNEPHVSLAPGSPQERWLRADLARYAGTCTLVLFHTPLFLSSNSAGYTRNVRLRALWDILDAGGVDVVLNAQQHHYERLAPLRPDGTRDDARGIRQFIVGTGGHSVVRPTVAIHPHSEVRAAAFGVLRLSLEQGAYAWRFVPVAGEPFTDAGAGTCH